MSPVESGALRSQHEMMFIRFLWHIAELFAQFPNLVGFSIQDRATVNGDREGARLDAELSVADVAVDTWPRADVKATGEEIAVRLLALLDEQPSVRPLLRGHTFARTFH
jgi:hypothetical protein